MDPDFESVLQDLKPAVHPGVYSLLCFFRYEHLPPHLRKISSPMASLALVMAASCDGPEATVGLRKLLEAKDCFVRSALGQQPTPKPAATPVPSPGVPVTKV